MTRENKLALIVAFALILGVSVLMSDHLSSARSTQPGEVRETTRLPSVPERAIRTLDDPRALASAQTKAPGGRIADPTDSPGLRPEGRPMTGPEPVLLVGGEAARPSLLDQLLNNLTGAPGAVSPEGGARSSADEPLVLNQTVVRPDRTGRTTPGGAGPGGTAGGAGVDLGPVRTHQVRAGESLYSIAQQYYGNGNLWRDLARVNEGKVRADGAVNVGVSLQIPTREALTGRPSATPPAAETPTVRPPAPEPAAPRREPAAPSPRTYTVARGDTLGDISMRNLGTSRRWREIYDLNKAQIPDPNNVRAGLVLVLPAS